MSPAYHYKKLENRFYHRIRKGLNSFGGIVAKAWKSFVALGRQRFTVMFIPHSERKIFNFQINVFTMAFILTLSGFLIVGFFVLSTHFTGTRQLLSVKSKNLDTAQANLEMIREEVADLQKVARVFQNTLNTTLGILGISVPNKQTPETSRGDISSFLSVSQVDDGKLRELHDVQNLKSFLKTAINPLNEIQEVLATQKDLLIDIPTLWPVKGVRGRVTQNFGPSIHPFTQQWYLHRGIDIAYGYNVPVVATARGKIVTIDYEPLGFGNYVTIRHRYGFYTRYAHLQRVFVSRGQDVQQGQVIAWMGNTGLSTGPHVHYEVMIGSEVVDPAKYLNISNNVSEVTEK